MKRLAILLMTVALPGLAAAEDVFIRVEAKRGTEAAEAAAAEWQARVGDLPAVTFPLNATWTAVALGPLPREAAEARMQELKAARTIPADSLLTAAEGVQTAAAPEAAPAVADITESVAQPGAASTAGLDSAPAVPAPPAPDRFLRLEAFQDRAEADAALNKWRQSIPEAGLWQMPNGWFAIAAGPLSEAAATQWLAALKGGGAIPDDSLIARTDEMGANVTPGTAPDWPENAASSPEMPPMAEVQELLSWAGFYDGEIDGQSGPQTRAAIAAELASQRETADPAQAMVNLKQQRMAWRDEMGLGTLQDDYTGLSLTAPLNLISHERDDRALSVYAPKDESGVALILFSTPGGQQEMEDMAGLVTALGWVPAPDRQIGKGRATLTGRNDTHIGHAESRVADGRVEGWVLIWPVADAKNAPRIAAEIADSFTRSQPPASERAETAPATPAALPAAN